MSTIDPWAQHWFGWIAAATWQLALLVCVVALANVALRGASPRLRHALWLVVLVKVFLPPSLTTPASAGRWIVSPMLDRTGLAQVAADDLLRFDRADGASALATASEPARPSRASPQAAWPLPVILMVVWAAGCMVFGITVAWRYARLVRATRSAQSIDEGPVRVALEQIALELGVRRVPELLATQTMASPFLFGVFRPRIVLPQRLLADLSETELRAVLTHELVHWKRRDTWIGWLQVVAQSLFWFHPFLWWAGAQLRHERECVCDDLVLRQGRINPERYGETIVRVLTASRGRSLVTGSLVGVFERGARLQNRLEDIMSYEPVRRRFGWTSRLALAVFAIVFLPMAPRAADVAVAQAPDGASAPAAKEPAKDQAQATPYPQIVKTVPEVGATGVDPALKEISVTFDRDMSSGMSWTGGPPDFPPTDKTYEKSSQARWIDARTCVLRVRLERGKYYRVGINSTSFQNFRSRDGVAAPPSAIFFTTEGATAALERRVRLPRVVEIEPANGATDVDPATTALRVTFDVPMNAGMSWTGSGEHFPTIPEGKKPAWSRDGRTCTLPVALKAGHDYQLGLNSLSHRNFQSRAGVALEPVVYKFRTSGAAK